MLPCADVPDAHRKKGRFRRWLDAIPAPNVEVNSDLRFEPETGSARCPTTPLSPQTASMSPPEERRTENESVEN
jgi:hypothetical protein